MDQSVINRTQAQLLMNDFIPSKMDTPEILAAIFHPSSEERNDTPPSCDEFEVTVSDDVVLGCRFFNPHAHSPVIIFFHGNGETVSDYDQIAPYYLEVGLNFFVASYRGYGWSTGEPSVGALLHDSALIFERVSEYCHNTGISGDFFIMGRSLGSAACIELGYRFPDLIKGIIIDSGFSYTLPLAARLGYNVSESRLNEEDCFNNLDKIREIKIPTLILHGAEDQLIPLNEAEMLQVESGARRKQLCVVPGADHNSLIVRGGSIYFETIKGFIDTVTVNRAAWRRKRKK